MIGYIGLILLLLAYIILLINFRVFIIIDLVASFLLCIHAITLQDIPFIIVNAFVTIMLLIKLIKNLWIKKF